METWVIVVLIVVGVLVLLAVSGGLNAGRRRRLSGPALRARVAAADRALAQAHAEDRGWERAGLESAARAAFQQHNPDRTIDRLVLVRVTDLPGVERDQAIFEVTAGDSATEVTLSRTPDGDWFADAPA